MLNMQELSRAFAKTTWQQADRSVGEWAGRSKGRDISARLSHCAGSRFEKASRNLNIKSIGVPESPHFILGGYDRVGDLSRVMMVSQKPSWS